MICMWRDRSLSYTRACSAMDQLGYGIRKPITRLSQISCITYKKRNSEVSKVLTDKLSVSILDDELILSSLT